MDSNILNMEEMELVGEGKTKKIFAMKKDNEKVSQSLPIPQFYHQSVIQHLNKVYFCP